MSHRRSVVEHARQTDLSDQIDDAVAVDARPSEPASESDLEVLVGRSVRLPLSIDEALKRVAKERGTTPSALIRQWVEAGLAMLENDRVVSLADVQRVLATLAKPPTAA